MQLLNTTIIRAYAHYSHLPEVRHMAQEMFTAYTQNGLPPDMALDEMEKSKKLVTEEKIAVVATFLGLLTQHKLTGGLTDRGHKQLQIRNKQMIEKLAVTGAFDYN